MDTKSTSLDNGRLPSTFFINSSGVTSASNSISNVRTAAKIKKNDDNNSHKKVVKKKMKKATRILLPGELTEEQKSNQIIPSNLHSFDRFFACLLLSSPKDFYEAHTSTTKALELWNMCCNRAGVSAPTEHISPAYDDPQQHFGARAALILEESRHAISNELALIWNKQQFHQKNKKNNKFNRIDDKSSSTGNKTGSSNTFRSKTSMSLILEKKKEFKESGHSKLTFVSKQKFTKDELFYIRPGSIVQCISKHNKRTIDNVTLGVVVTGSQEQVEQKNKFTCLIFRYILQVGLNGTEFIVTPVTQLVTELRCFESLQLTEAPISFLPSLLGKAKTQTSINNEGKSKVSKVKKQKSSKTSTAVTDNTFFHLPTLNEKQDEAAASFLGSDQNTITLVQGPPGTGKTTLLVSILCRYLTESIQNDKEYRIMVSAPTNKAISVLAARFLEAMKDNCPCNVIMVGDADKLLVDESSNTRSRSGQLKSIFLYTWIQNVVDGYSRIKAFFMPHYRGRDTAQSLLKLARNLQTRVSHSLSISKTVSNLMGQIITLLESVLNGGKPCDIVSLITALLKEITEIKQEIAWAQLLSSANVIFCTLSSAGGKLLKKTSHINDLIIDEAAAATEPELYIPFHLQPTRLLAVGDPLQLPATVLSQKAIDLGLSKSLHERLMYECGFEHIMLDIQYRMNPEISSFPSRRFYNSRIGNGPNVSSKKYLNGPRLQDKLPCMFLQVEGEEEQHLTGSYFNQAEAKTIVELIKELKNSASKKQRSSWYSADRIRVITFYHAQVNLINHLLYEKGLGNKIVVATVDASQGCEADIVLISFVRSPNRRKGHHSSGFLNDDRRLNVALTRAKYQLICVGNVHNYSRMSGSETLKLLSKDVGERGLVRATFIADRVNAERKLSYGKAQPSKRLKTG